MTWILGSAVPFGYGALISDVRASWPDGRKLDRLQKIHPIGPGLMAGFAGSVAVGFSMIALMRRRCCAPPGTLYPVKRVAWHWSRFARRFYQGAVAPPFKSLGCELLLVGISPEQSGPFLLSHALRMRAPAFELEPIPVWTWGSIGEGALHAAAADYGERERFWDVWLRGEIANSGGAALALAHAVATDLERLPMESVSPILQIGLIRNSGYEVLSLRRDRNGAWSRAKWEHTPKGETLSTWSEFEAAAAAAGLEARGAVT